MFDTYEAALLSDKVRRRNVFARHSQENNFYLSRISDMANSTIIEVRRPGHPDEIYEVAEQIAELIEKIVVLSTTFVLLKGTLHRKLGINKHPMPRIDLTVGSGFQFIRSRSQRFQEVEGILIDERFSRRFSRCGFFGLFQYCLEPADLAKRVNASANWLYESRRETQLQASIVKTAIALETLLIFSESESLARTLSERAAFILSCVPETRVEISHIIKQFYEVRSGVVHGSKAKIRKLTPELIEGVDRLTLLLHLAVAANRDLWTNVETLRLWCEDQRWGHPATNVKVPFPQAYLRHALSLCSR